MQGLSFRRDAVVPISIAVLTLAIPFIFRQRMEVQLSPLFSYLTLLCTVVTVLGLCPSITPLLVLFVLLAIESYVSVALDVEGEGDEDVSDDGGDDTDE